MNDPESRWGPLEEEPPDWRERLEVRELAYELLDLFDLDTSRIADYLAQEEK